MMIRRGGIIMALLCAMAVFGSFDSIAGVFEARQVEFKGLKYLTARELMEKVRFTKENDLLRVDADSLKDALAKNPMVRTSSISIVGEKLMVRIVEREPAYVCAVVKGRETIPFELDASYAVISVRNVHRTDVPMVILEEEDFSGGRLSARALDFFGSLSRLQKNLAGVYREISEVRFLSHEAYEIRLKGRRTKIVVRDGAFTTLKYILSALDEKKYYPNALWVGPSFGVIK
jgi:hypothetical protein